MTKHWTEESDAALIFAISSDFISEVKQYMAQHSVGCAQLAKKLGITSEQLVQVFERPRISVKRMVQIVKALELKLALVAYEQKGAPVHASLFRECWETLGRPRDGFEMEEVREKHDHRK